MSPEMIVESAKKRLSKCLVHYRVLIEDEVINAVPTYLAAETEALVAELLAEIDLVKAALKIAKQRQRRRKKIRMQRPALLREVALLKGRLCRIEDIARKARVTKEEGQ